MLQYHGQRPPFQTPLVPTLGLPFRPSIQRLFPRKSHPPMQCHLPQRFPELRHLAHRCNHLVMLYSSYRHCLPRQTTESPPKHPDWTVPTRSDSADPPRLPCATSRSSSWVAPHSVLPARCTRLLYATRASEQSPCMRGWSFMTGAAQNCSVHKALASSTARPVGCKCTSSGVELSLRVQTGRTVKLR